LDRIALIQYLIAKFILWSLEHGPLTLARFYTRILDLAVPRLRRVARRNLELAYPEKTPEERERIIGEVFASIARMLWTTTSPSGFVMRGWSTTPKPRRSGTAFCLPPRTWATGS
jgi:lauroyl/myristoyl acyltransferase